MDALVSNDVAGEFIKSSINLIMAYNRFCIQSKIKYRFLRKENATFNSICEVVEGLCKLIVAVFEWVAYNKVEPTAPAWVSICQYVPAGNGMCAITHDTYAEFSKQELENWSNDPYEVLDVKGPYHDIFCSKYTDATNGFKCWFDYKLTDTILIGQVCPRATIIRFAKNANFDKDSALERSSTRMLEVEYHCGDRIPLEIEIPKSHYFAGNEILSKTYVLRYLEHLYNFSNWIYRESDYSLRIVDDNSEVFSLNSNQYIRLEEDGYKIVDITEEEEDTSKPPEEEEEETKEYLEN